MVIAVTGKCSSGKTTFSNYINCMYGYTVYEIGNYVRQAYNTFNSNNITLIEFVDKYYQRGNLSHFVQEAINNSLSEHQNNLIFCGIRTIDEFKYIKKEYSNSILVYIKCLDSYRKKRYVKFSKDLISLEKRTIIEDRWSGNINMEKIADYTIEKYSPNNPAPIKIEETVLK